MRRSGRLPSTAMLLLSLSLVVALFGQIGAPESTRAQSAYSIVYSTSSNRSNPAPLDGRTVSGNIYAFTTPVDDGITLVRFFLDDPGMTGSPRQVENNPPYDFAGGSTSKADPLKTTSLSDGPHTITAALDMDDGTTEVIHAAFTVRNSTATGLEFDVASLSFAAPANGSPVSQSVTVSTIDGSTASLTLTSDVSWLTVSPSSGTAPLQVTVTATPGILPEGVYTGTLRATGPGMASANLNVAFGIPDVGPDQVHLAWVADPATTLTVVWRTLDPTVPSVVEYRAAGSTAWQSATGATRPSGTTGKLHEVTLSSLTPATTYQYRVQGPGGTWSEIFETRTAPGSGAADFDFIYVADTGLIGRQDGLATGTRQVIDEIAGLNPHLILAGGDFAYFNTDKRFGNLENTIDAWFNQMQPAISRAPVMPAYGNHEALLSEKSSTWAERFPTPPGFDGHRNYSFDVGDVHFVAIFAVENDDPLPAATIDWIRQDIQAAQAAGQRWIIPFFHVSPFAEGKNHPSNLALRAQLGPLFESLGVQIVIASHDQSYERTYPLVDVPDTNTPTSTSTSCYTMQDGVTWIKVSPGGKLSNISGNFSPWKTSTAPAWTAFRDNTMHHFLRVRVSAEGKLIVEAFGVSGNGSAPVIQDRFEYTTADCPPPDTTPPAAPTGLSATASDDGIALDWADNGEADLAGYRVYRSGNASGPFFPLTAAPVTSSQYFDAQAPAGVSYYQVTAVDQDGNESDPSATVDAERPAPPPAAFEIVVSTSNRRTNPVPLEGQTVSGNVYVFTTPTDSSIAGVRFYLDDPGMTGGPHQIETNPPYDFAGGSTSKADPFKTTSIANGPHTITAALDMDDGTTQVIHARFTVQNG